jgi:hypothetical protein
MLLKELYDVEHNLNIFSFKISYYLRFITKYAMKRFVLRRQESNIKDLYEHINLLNILLNAMKACSEKSDSQGRL